MTDAHDDSTQMNHQDVHELVESVQALGERARFLAVNLAVVAGRIRKEGTATSRLNEDILDLVARITRASQDVTDAVGAMERGRQGKCPASQGMWLKWEDAGVPDEQTLERLTRSLNETLELSRYVFRLIRDRSDMAARTGKRRPGPELSWSDDHAEGETS
jgi:hypothetical protein